MSTTAKQLRCSKPGAALFCAPAGAPLQLSFTPVLNERAPNCVPEDTVPFEVPTVSGGNERIDGTERLTGQRGTKCASRGVKKGELQ
jgi:hypothetical protein